MTWKLQTVTGEFTGKEVSIEQDMLVGRHQDANLLIQSADISRRHAALLLKDNALWVQDLKSSNGTFVNDIQIVNETLLKQGDIVQFAAHKFSVLEPAQIHLNSEAVSVVGTDKIFGDSSAKAVVTETTPQSQEQAEVNIDSLAGSLSATENKIQQPAEAIATSESAQSAPVSAETPSQAMADQGILDLKERDTHVILDRDGMPKNIGVPKPAPIPEGVDIQNPSLNVENSTSLDVPEYCSTREEETQKNASIGLMALVVLFIVAMIAWYLLS